MSSAPTLEVELGLVAAGADLVIGCDEVGRGAIAGPVAVGIVAVDPRLGGVPEGLRDSKLLSPRRREALHGPVSLGRHRAVGFGARRRSTSRVAPRSARRAARARRSLTVASPAPSCC